MENRTGVYYQAMPAVGPDGKNVMKLIPVQKVDGKFVQTHVLTSRNDRQPRVYSQPAQIAQLSLPQNKVPTLQQTADGRYILKTASESSTLLSSVKTQHQGTVGLLKDNASQVHVSLVAPKVTPNTLQLPLQNNSKALTVINSPQQPATVKSQFIPSGHYLQIPPNATIRTLPASALPQSVKNQICHSLNVPSTPAKGLSTVLYVSPVNSLKLGPTQQVPGVLKAGELPQSLVQTPSTSSVKSLNVSSTSSTKPAPEITTPIKWVVEEREGSTAPCIIPVTSPSMPTDILKAVKQLETVRQGNQVTAAGPTPTSALTVSDRINPGNDNALVMCNGKVYFVAKKNTDMAKDVISGAGSKQPVRNSVQPFVESYTSNTSLTQDPKKGPVSKKQNEIIDLCDDDDESSTSVESSTLTVASENDEDSNVIFVSYIPPKSETLNNKKASETVPQTSCSKDTENPERSAENVEMSHQRNGTDSPVTDIHVSRYEDNAAADEGVNKGGAVSDQPEEVCDQVTEVTEESLVDSVTLCNENSKADIEMNFETPAQEESNQQKSDSELRQSFGITSDLKICLQRLNQTKEPGLQTERRSINKRTLEGIRKLIQESQIELKINQLIRAQMSKRESGPTEAKRKHLEDGPSFGQTNLDSFPSTVADSSLQSMDTTDCNELQVMTTHPCTDSKTLQCCQHAEEEPPSCSGSSEGYENTVCSSSCSLQLVETLTDGTAGRSVSRKTLPRQSKGSGRVCTACPCGTKVGALMTNSSSRPEEKLTLTCNSSKHAHTDCNRVIKVGKKSVSSDTSRDASIHTSQTGTKHVKDSLQNSASLMRQQDDDVSKPELSPEAATRSNSKSDTQGETCEKVTHGHAEAAPHEPNSPKEAEVKSAPEGLDLKEKVPSEFYSSIMLDPEEIERRERIKRLKDLLKEKEAALEKLRQSM